MTARNLNVIVKSLVDDQRPKLILVGHSND
jgi:hypothetical protein